MAYLGYLDLDSYRPVCGKFPTSVNFAVFEGRCEEGIQEDKVYSTLSGIIIGVAGRLPNAVTARLRLIPGVDPALFFQHFHNSRDALQLPIDISNNDLGPFRQLLELVLDNGDDVVGPGNNV